MSNGGHPTICPVNSTTNFGGSGVCLFLAVTAGTITIQDVRLIGGTPTQVILLGPYPVTAGSWTPLDFYVNHLGGQIVTAGGASGTLVTK